MLGRLAGHNYVLAEAETRDMHALVRTMPKTQHLTTQADFVASFPRLAQGVAAYVVSHGAPESVLELVKRRTAAGTKNKSLPKNSKELRARSHVFLSYCHEDRERVRELRSALVAEGETVWWDQDLQGGQDFKFEIDRALKGAHAFIACLSQRAVSRLSSGMYPELLDAIAAYRKYRPGSIFLIPVRFSACQVPRIAIDDTRTLEQLQRVDLFPVSRRAEGIARLVRAIRSAPNHPAMRRA
jgi:hypothetical protein